MKEFPWGKVTKIHQIGDHTITEYVGGPGWSNPGETEFHAYDTTYNSLEEAMLGVVCQCFQPNDCHIYTYAHRLIAGVPEGEDE